MSDADRRPGIGREQRISREGLDRLARQMHSGAPISDLVLTQWIRRYGDPARRIISNQGRYHPGLEPRERMIRRRLLVMMGDPRQSCSRQYTPAEA